MEWLVIISSLIILGCAYLCLGDIRIRHTRVVIFGVSIQRALLEHRHKKKHK